MIPSEIALGGSSVGIFGFRPTGKFGVKACQHQQRYYPLDYTLIPLNQHRKSVGSAAQLVSDEMWVQE